MLALSLDMGGTHIMRGGNVALLRTVPLHRKISRPRKQRRAGDFY
jgi:hypothetical protein